MGKRYYCDFCNRSFADSGLNRKNHFKGVTHKRLRKQHYDAFRDAATILGEDAAKVPCTRFLNGTCSFDDSCKFSHMTPERRTQLETQVASERVQKRQREEEKLAIPSLEEWLAKRKKVSSQDDTPGENTKTDIRYELPPFLACVPNLPPSLLPPTADEMKNTTHCEWG